MSTYRKNLNVTELDFDNIKQNLIDYFKNADSKFTDWDFAGSGLNVLVDALAYNTHYNAILAHMAISEGFIDSAQLRSSVVSLAKLIGYTPRSYSAASASITFSLNAVADSPDSVVIPKNAQFTSSFGGITYRFTTDDEYTIIKDSGKYTQNNVVLRQGVERTSKFQVNYSKSSKNSNYIINENKIDVNSLIVKVYSSDSSFTVPEIFYRVEDNITGIDDKSPIYFLSENSDENYQISFGDGIFGKKLQNLSRIELTYLATDGSNANGCRTFVYSDSIPIGTASATCVTESIASGGSAKETIESIRYNAPLSFVTQNRAVTADDYKTLILKSFGNIQSISVWGGEDHIPVSYGQVFISIKPYGADTLTTLQQKEILDYLKLKKVLSIMPALIDPEYIDLTLDVFFKYDRNAISMSRGEIESAIRNRIQYYSTTTLESFNGVFRYSNLMKDIDTYHPAILNSHIRVFVSRTTSFDPENLSNKTINFGTSLSIDDGRSIISCSPFEIDGNICYFGDESILNSTNLRKIYVYYNRNSEQVKVLNDVGTLDLNTGNMNLKEVLMDIATDVTFDVLPESNDIAPKRNQLLKINMNRLSVRGEVDTISLGGSSRAVDYNTFKRDR